MAIDIKDRMGNVIYAATASTVKEALEEALAVPQTDFQEAALAGVDLTGAVLTGIDLTNADLYNAILTGADFTDAILTGAVLTGATMDAPTVEVVDKFSIMDSYNISGYDGSLTDGMVKIHLGADLEYNQMNIMPFMAVAEVGSEMITLTATPLLEEKIMLSGVAGITVTIKNDVLLANGQMTVWPSAGVITKQYATIEITISGFIG